MENKSKVIGLLLLIITLLTWSLFSSKELTRTSLKHVPVLTLGTAGDITCTYPQTLYASNINGEIIHELPNPEKNPIIFTFSDMEEEVSKLKFIDASRSISEVPIVKILDTKEKMVFFEGSGDPYITIHSIYKNKGVATYSKQISIFGTPTATLAMGTCI